MTNSILGFSEDRVLEAMHDIERGIDYIISQVVQEEKKIWELGFDCDLALYSFIDDFYQRYEHGDWDLPAKISMCVGFFLDFAEKSKEAKKRIQEMKAEKKAKDDEKKVARKKAFEEKLMSLKNDFRCECDTIRSRYGYAIYNYGRPTRTPIIDIVLTNLDDVDQYVDLWIKSQYSFGYRICEYTELFEAISSVMTRKQTLLEYLYREFTELTAPEDDDYVIEDEYYAADNR